MTDTIDEDQKASDAIPEIPETLAVSATVGRDRDVDKGPETSETLADIIDPSDDTGMKRARSPGEEDAQGLAEAVMQDQIQRVIERTAASKVKELGIDVIQKDGKAVLQAFLRGALADGELKSDFNAQTEALNLLRRRVEDEQANASASAVDSAASIQRITEHLTSLNNEPKGIGTAMMPIASEITLQLAVTTPSGLSPMSVEATETAPEMAAVANAFVTQTTVDPVRLAVAEEMLEAMVAAVRQATAHLDKDNAQKLTTLQRRVGKHQMGRYDKMMNELVAERMDYLRANPNARVSATGTLFVHEGSRQWGKNSEPRMPTQAELEQEFPGDSNAQWRKWMNEHVRNAHPGNSNKSRDNKLTEVMRDDIKYGQCDAPEYREGSAGFVRKPHIKGGGIVFGKDSDGNVVPQRHPKTNILYTGSHIKIADGSATRYRKIIVNGVPLLSNIDGTPLAVPESRLEKMKAIAAHFETGTMDGNGGPAYVKGHPRRAVRALDKGYAVVIPIRMNNYHWEAQYGRGLINPLPEACCVAPVARRYGYDPTDPELLNKLATVPQSKFDRKGYEGVMATSAFSLPILPCRSTADAGLRDALCVTTAKTASQEAADTPAQAKIIVKREKEKKRFNVTQEQIDKAREQWRKDAKDNTATDEEAAKAADRGQAAVVMAAGASFLDYMPTKSRLQETYIAVNGETFNISDDEVSKSDFVKLVDASSRLYNVNAPEGVKRAEHLRLIMFSAARPQFFSEHPSRSGSSTAQTIEFDTRRLPSPADLPEAPILTGYTPDKKGKGKSGRYPTVNLFPTAFTKERWEKLDRKPEPGKILLAVPRSSAAVISGNAQDRRPACLGIPFSLPSDTENHMLGEQLKPALLAPFTLKHVVERFLVDNYDGFQYQTTSEHDAIYDPDGFLDIPARKRSDTESVLPGFTESVLPGFTPTPRLIKRPLPQHLGKGGLYASIRLDIGGDAGNGGLDSFLPADPDWGLQRLASKGVRGLDEIWDSRDSDLTGARATRNGAPYWFSRETKAMSNNPTSPWLQDDAPGRRPMPDIMPDSSCVPNEFIPPERLDLSNNNLVKILHNMSTNRLERRNEPEMSASRERGETLQAMQDEFDEEDEARLETVEEHYASTEDQGVAAAQKRADEEESESDDGGLTQAIEEELLREGDELMQVEDTEAPLSTAAPSGAKARAPEADRRKKTLFFPLYVTLFDADDFAQARYKIDCEWQAFGERYPDYLVQADRFHLNPQTKELDEGISTYFDHRTGKIETMAYVPPHVANRGPGGGYSPSAHVIRARLTLVSVPVSRNKGDARRQRLQKDAPLHPTGRAAPRVVAPRPARVWSRPGPAAKGVAWQGIRRTRRARRVLMGGRHRATQDGLSAPRGRMDGSLGTTQVRNGNRSPTHPGRNGRPRVLDVGTYPRAAAVLVLLPTNGLHQAAATVAAHGRIAHRYPALHPRPAARLCRIRGALAPSRRAGRKDAARLCPQRRGHDCQARLGASAHSQPIGATSTRVGHPHP